MSPEDALRNVLQLAEQEQRDAGRDWRGLGSRELAQRAGLSWSSAKRVLLQMLASGQVRRNGRASSTRYLLPVAAEMATAPALADDLRATSSAGAALLAALQRPLGQRPPVGYQRDFVDGYVPNQSTLLPDALLRRLAASAKMGGQQPAGTYARNVITPLLIDLSWSSSRLEGNRYSLLDTRDLFESGIQGGDADAVMLLNHKKAIEFLVNDVPMLGLSEGVICNLHALLLRDLLNDDRGLGTIRSKIVQISDTSYVPAQMPQLLKDMFGKIVAKAQEINNPIEAAFFLWVNIAYLQPFEDGNKRTSRLAANIPLLMYNFAPLSFLDIDSADYAYAMMGVYEQCNTALAADLFEMAYARSVEKYKVQLEAVSAPDPDRLRLRGAMNDAMGMIIRDRLSLDDAMAALKLNATDVAVLKGFVAQEILNVGEHNYARFNLTLGQLRNWINDGRPG